MDLTSISNYETYQVTKAPLKAFYIPNFINEKEEEFVLRKLYEAPKPKWVQLSNRRLQNWGGFPHPKGMVSESIPSWLKSYMTKVDALNLLDGNCTNHVLVNEYLAGQGIMPHVDGPIFYPTITTINLGSHTVLDLYHPLNNCESPDGNLESDTTENEDTDNTSRNDWASRRIGSLLLEPRSLLILQKDLYTKYLHGIAERDTDTVDKSIFNIDMTSSRLSDVLSRDTRVSLTIRYFPKVLKFKLSKFKS